MGKGRCSICGEVEDLTFEHIPPKSSGNNKPVKIISGDQVIFSDRNPWETVGQKYTLQQKGMGKCILCASCNNITGSWYAADFKSFYFQIPFIKVNPIDPKCSFIEQSFLKIYPLRVIKQIASMFMGLCGVNLGDEYPEIKEFVLSKNAQCLNFNKYRFSFFVRRGSFRNPQQFARSTMIRGVNQECEYNKVSYIDTDTVEFLFEEKGNGKLPDEMLGVDLCQFAKDFNYDECVSLKVLMPTFERNSWIPYDVRTQEEILMEIEKNRKWAQENGVK
ncbi:MAG: hypothetical protein ACK5JF_11035 [Oscillospiraceae bacterium]